MQHPPYLKKGSTIGITCPASFVSNEKIYPAIELLQEKGFRVKVGTTVGNEFHYFSGDDNTRLSDLQNMLDDENLDAILMGRGGYGMSRIIDKLDFKKFQQKPKWICGFSDITVLHNHLHANLGIPSFHSPMCGAFKAETENTAPVIQFFQAICGEELTYQTPTNLHNRYGETEGILTGGNLAILAHLSGSSSEVNMDGKILFIEDIGEHLYQIDRLMINLERAGKLNKLQGLIVGSFTDIEDTERPFGQTVEEIILDKVQEYDYPVCFQLACGHQEENYTLTLGMKHTLKVNEEGGVLTLKRNN